MIEAAYETVSVHVQRSLVRSEVGVGVVVQCYARVHIQRSSTGEVGGGGWGRGGLDSCAMLQVCCCRNEVYLEQMLMFYIVWLR